MLKPVDIIVVVKLAAQPEVEWSQARLGHELDISQSNVHRALRQLEASRLVRGWRPQMTALSELLRYAVKYVYPAKLGAPARGIVTAHSALQDEIVAPNLYVWPHDEGSAYGTALAPLHPAVPAAASRDAEFHELMALVDVFRVGRVRERQLAEKRLQTILGLGHDESD